MAKRALEQNVSYEEVEAMFRESRQSNGVAIRAARVPKGRQTRQTTLTGATVEELEDDDGVDEQTSAYEKDFGEERKNSVVSEMTEFESDDEA